MASDGEARELGVRSPKAQNLFLEAGPEITSEDGMPRQQLQGEASPGPHTSATLWRQAQHLA